MPYARMRRRRGYGRRRRYGRRSRRPRASRAVPRISLAPRHQYLKLRQSLSIVNTAAGGMTWVMRPDVPYRPFGSLTNVTITPGSGVADTPPLGWSGYGQLFQRYCVHGTKYTAKVLYDQGSSTKTAIATDWAAMTEAVTSGIGYALRRFPVSGIITVGSTKPTYFKKYLNRNSMMGQNVSKFDRYIFDWNKNDSGELFIQFYTDAVPSGATLSFYFTITYYLSALSVNAQGNEPALLELTEPGNPLGTVTDGLAEDHQGVMSGDIAHSSAALRSTNTGGVKRYRD